LLRIRTSNCSLPQYFRCFIYPHCCVHVWLSTETWYILWHCRPIYSLFVSRIMGVRFVFLILMVAFFTYSLVSYYAVCESSVCISFCFAFCIIYARTCPCEVVGVVLPVLGYVTYCKKITDLRINVQNNTTWICRFGMLINQQSRFRWPRVLKRGFTTARLLVLLVRISPWVWLCVSW